jgi:hypothetical protein
VKDLIVIAMTLAFFGICVAYVALCNRIIGPDEPDDQSHDISQALDEPADADLGGDAGDRPGAEVTG